MLMIVLMAVLSLESIKSTCAPAEKFHSQYHGRQLEKYNLIQQTNSSDIKTPSTKNCNPELEFTTIPSSATNETKSPKKSRINREFKINVVSASENTLLPKQNRSKILVPKNNVTNIKNVPWKVGAKRKKEIRQQSSSNHTENSLKISKKNLKPMASNSDPILLQYYPSPAAAAAIINPDLNINGNPTINPNNNNVGGNIFDVNYDILMSTVTSQPAYITPNYYQNNYDNNVIATIPYKTVPQSLSHEINQLQSYPTNDNQLLQMLPININNNNRYHHWTIPGSTSDRSASLRPISMASIYDSVNPKQVTAQSRKPAPSFPHRPKPIIHRNPIVQVRPPYPISSTILPPLKTVTHVFKYSEDPSENFKLPFLSTNDDTLDIPALSAVLQQTNDRILLPPHYLTPPKINQPIFYSMSPIQVVTNPSMPLQMPNGFGNEFQVINKFNSVLQKPKQNFRILKNEEDESTELEDQGEKSMTDEEIQKAVQYIQTLKKNKNKSRKRKKNKQQPKESFEEEIEQDVKDHHTYGMKTNLKNELFEDDDDENYQISNENQDNDDDNDVNENADNRKLSLIDSQENMSNQNSQISDDEQHDEEGYVSAPNIYQNTESETEAAAADEDAEKNSNTESNNTDVPDFSQNSEIGSENDGDRVEFQMHGLVGPESYKFGYDTGKGDNRQFRYEERDGDGKVKGHYGYYDQHGTLQLFNYAADENGYQLQRGALR